MKFSISTLGCKVNNYESEMIKEKLLSNSFFEVDINENPDICIINTCSVTNSADSKSMQTLRKVKRLNPNSLIILCGCTVESHTDILEETNANIIIGNKDKSEIINLINEYFKTHEKIIRMYDLTKAEFEDMEIKSYESKTRAFVKIEDGCNNFCSYCIIPYVRGRERSKKYGDVISEIKNLSINHKEVVLTGIHTGAYNDSGKKLIDIIKEISTFNNLKRIRISSIEITELTDAFFEELKTNNKICNHLHIPVQSGCDKTLKAMNRKYDTEYYKNIINRIRSIRPDISITTDLIVGFPNETDEDFESTLNFAREISFSKIHVFPYSVRKNTKAEKMEKHVQEKIKKARVKIMLNLSDELELKYYQSFIGKTLQVLIEKSNDISYGHASNYLYVKILDKLEYNEIYNVTVTKVIDKEIISKIKNVHK